MAIGLKKKGEPAKATEPKAGFPTQPEPKIEPAADPQGCLAVVNDKVCGKPLAPGQSAVCAAHIRTN